VSLGLASRPTRDPLIGATVGGRFKVEELIGQGGMGKVYRARHLALDRLVCLKMLKPALLEDPTVVGRFEREAMAASRLNHPNSIQVLDFGRNEADGALYLVMEYVQGKDLRAILRDEWPVPEERLCRIMAQVLAALGEAHAHHVIHRDLKPENIMVEQRRDHPDFVKVLDFGIAKILDSDLPGLTRADVVCGTPQYMAPEQATGGKLDARCDLYAVGIMLYQMATSQLPFDGESSMDVLTRQVHEAPVPPRKRQPGAPISERMESLILHVLSKDPARRPQSAEEFRQLLLAVPHGNDAAGRAERATHDPRPAVATQARGSSQPAKTRAKTAEGAQKRLLPSSAIAGAAAVVLLAGLALRWQRSNPDRPKLGMSAVGVPGSRDAAHARKLVRSAAEREAASDHGAARDLLLQAIEADPENAEAHYRLGGLMRGSQPERARQEYAAAKRLDAEKYGDAVDTILKGL
jgi:serine/threonine-protein kinase